MHRQAIVWVQEFPTYPAFWFLIAFVVIAAAIFGLKATSQQIGQYRSNHRPKLNNNNGNWTTGHNPGDEKDASRR